MSSWTSSRYSIPLPSICCVGQPTTTTIRSGRFTRPHCRPPCAKVCLSRSAPSTLASPLKGARNLIEPSSKRAPQQRALLAWLADRAEATAAEVGETFKPELLKSLAARGWIAARRSGAAASDAPDLDPNADASWRARAHRCARSGRQYHSRRIAQLQRAPALRGDRQRQDGGVPAGHRRGHRSRRPSPGPRTGDRPDASAGRALSAPFQRRRCRRALGPDG